MSANKANTAASRPKNPYAPDASPKTANIVVVGSLHLDFINLVDSHPARGSHVRAKTAIDAPGGHGANQAVACARLSGLPASSMIPEGSYADQSLQPSLGVEVFMIGAVGSEDDFGDRIKAELEKNKVNIDGIFTIQGEKTGYAHINVDADGEPTIVVTPMANDKLLPGPTLKLEPSPNVVLVQLEIPQNTVRHVLAWAKSQEAITIFNAAPATYSVPQELFQVDHFIVNEDQADELNGYPIRLFKDRYGQRSEIRQHYQNLCERFHENGAKCVVITIAELGAVGSRKDPRSGVLQQYVFDAEQGPESVKDTTGATDAFVGGYTIELIHQTQLGIRQDMASAMQMGIKAAGLSISRVGSMQAIPWPKEILATEFRAARS